MKNQCFEIGRTLQLALFATARSELRRNNYYYTFFTLKKTSAANNCLNQKIFCIIAEEYHNTPRTKYNHVLEEINMWVRLRQ